MSLRHTEEAETRLTPEEARAFLQVHAEREAAPASPTAEELAEFLNLSPGETQAILREVRTRLAGARPRSRLPVLLATAGALLLALTTIAQVASAPPAAEVPAPTSALAPTPPALAPPAPSRVAPVPDGFELIVAAGESSISREGGAARFGSDFRALDAAEAGALRARLAEGTLGMLDSALEGAQADWRKARSLSIQVRVGDGGWTAFDLPLRPFALPFEGNPGGRAYLREDLKKVYAARWKAILERAPR